MSLILNQFHSASDGIIGVADNDRMGSLLGVRSGREIQRRYFECYDLMVIRRGKFLSSWI